MTAFQRHAANKIRHIGGSIFYASDKSWIDAFGHRVFVPSEDFKTDGFIGWPTIRALVEHGILRQPVGNKYSLI